MKYSVYIRPPEEFFELGEQYRKSIPDYIPEIPANITHCTLMTGRFNESDETSIIKSLESISQAPFLVKSDSLDLFAENCLVLRIKKSESLAQLHDKVINELKKYIDWTETPPISSLYRLDKRRARIHEEFGSPFCGEFYQPHITLCQVNPSIFDDGKINEDIFANYGWEVREIYLAKKQGTWKTVRKFRL